MNRPPWILPAIVVGQLLVTATWFAPNAVIGHLQTLWGASGGVGMVTTAVQIGFISGTLVFALAGIADRFHASSVFLCSALVAAGSNMLVVAAPGWFTGALVARFVTGVSLAGVYPVGMKIAAGWFAGGLGRALGYLVGALVLGTASPHLLHALGQEWDWRFVFLGSSLAAVAGGVLVSRVPEGPNLARTGRIRVGGILAAFRVPGFRAAAFGYFGHMWELYGFWAFAPVWLAAYGFHGERLSLLSFGAIGLGALGCAGGGFLSVWLGSGRIALGQLAVSGLCCLLSPLLFAASPATVVAFFLVWGLTVSGDSPQFSALNARNAPTEVVGSALTLTNCIGFSLTIPSLMLLDWLHAHVGPAYLLIVLAPGPAFGLWAGRRLLRDRASRAAAPAR